MTNKSRIRSTAILSTVFALLFALCCPGLGQTRPAKLIVSNAYIFSMAADQRAPFHGYLVVGQDGRLVTVAAGEPPAALKAATV